MLNRLRETGKLGECLILLLLCIFCLAASVFRYCYANSFQFLFLNWNLLLAAIPWLLTTFLALNEEWQKSRLGLLIIFLIWCLFFPNAPYILTDLIHLRLDSEMPLWFNLVYILAFSWTGLLFGFLSLMDIERFVKIYFRPFTVFFFSTFLLFLASFGIYLGRFLEMNSWDLFYEPLIVLRTLTKYFVHPMNHLDTWGLTLFMGGFLNLVYWSLKVLIEK